MKTQCLGKTFRGKKRKRILESVSLRCKKQKVVSLYQTVELLKKDKFLLLSLEDIMKGGTYQSKSIITVLLQN